MFGKPDGIILPNSGYKNLIVYKKSDVIYQGTVVFCQRFLPPYGDRTVDQMTQAARSCKQNIVEGSSVAATSLETQIKLTNVARASLAELLEDYLDYLKAHGDMEWSIDDTRKNNARDFARSHADWNDWKPVFISCPAETFCNLMIVLIQQTRYLLERMIKWQENDFGNHGGVRERMYAVRKETKAGGNNDTIDSMLWCATDPADLARRAASIVNVVQQTVDAIKRTKGW